MKNAFHKNSQCTGTRHIHVERPLNPQIRIKIDLKTKRYDVKTKLHRNTGKEN